MTPQEEAREESPDKARQIVAAAQHCLRERGYEATSIKDIAAQAGVAPGLVHYYFKDKAELLVEVVRTLDKRYHAEVEGVTLEVPPGNKLHTVMAAAYERYSQPDWYRLLFPLLGVGLQNEQIGREVAELFERARRQILSISSVVGSDLGAPPSTDYETLSSVILAFCEGMAIQAPFTTDFDIRRHYDLFSAMLAAYARYGQEMEAQSDVSVSKETQSPKESK